MGAGKAPINAAAETVHSYMRDAAAPVGPHTVRHTVMTAAAPTKVWRHPAATVRL